MRLARPFFAVLAASAADILAVPLHAETTAQAERAGLPQFDFAFFPGQIFWLAITFTVLYILMSRIALPGVARTQEKRRAAIAADLAAASAANEEAKKLIASYEKTLADAHAEGRAILNDLTRKTAQQLMDRQAEQQQILNKRLLEAEARIGAARAAALADAQGAIAELADIALEKIVGSKAQVKP
jgi:F-type H+-transporting ATPase subunit b